LKEQDLNIRTLPFLRTFALSPQGQVPDHHGDVTIDIRGGIQSMRITRPAGAELRLKLEAYPFLAMVPDDSPRYHFLPWRSNAITKYQIPNGAAGAPNLFFTAGLMGCSVFIRPPEAPYLSPSVYHAGSERGVRLLTLAVADATADAARAQGATEYWREAYKSLTTNQGVRGNLTDVGETSRSDYITHERVNWFQTRFDLFQRRHGRTRRNTPVSGGGAAVIGIRNGGNNWAFYVQEAVWVIYRSSTGVELKTAFPIRIRQIYPTNQARVIWDGISRLLPDHIDDHMILAP